MAQKFQSTDGQNGLLISQSHENWQWQRQRK